MIILPKIIDNKKVILDAIKTEIKSINNDINSQNDIKRKIVSYFRDFVYHIDFLQLDYISDSLKNIVSYLDISDATLDIYEALLAQVYDIKVQVKKNSDIDKYRKLIDLYNNKYEEQSKIISSNVSKINGLFTTSFSEIHTDTENLENTLVIDEINSQVILPYNLKDIYNLLKHDTTYNTINDAVNSIYRKPLSYYKNAPIARFREAYKLIKNREHGSTKEAIDLGLELMFNGKLHPAIISSCKTLDQLDIYLSCLEYNELNDFHFFKVLYKALPDTQKKRGFLKSRFSGQLQKILNQSKEIIGTKITGKHDIITETETDFNNKLEEIKQKHQAIESTPTDSKLTITGYKTLFFGEENITEEQPLFSITGYKTIKLQNQATDTEVITEKEETNIEQTVVDDTLLTESINDLIDSIQDNYNGTKHTRVERTLDAVIEETQKTSKEPHKRTIVRPATIRTIDNVAKDKRAEEARLASLRIITGARTIHFPKKLFTITGYKTFKLKQKPSFTITGYRIFKLKQKPSFTITGYRIFKLKQKPTFTITGYRIFKLKQKPTFTITGYRIFKLKQKPSFTITGYRIFKLQAQLITITGYKTIHFGIGDVEIIPEEKNIEEELHKLSEPTQVNSNKVKDVFASLKQLQANTKYYYEPPQVIEEDNIDGIIEETTEEQTEEEHSNFTNRFDISKINTSAQEDPLLSAIESLDDFDDETNGHLDSDLNGIQDETISSDSMSNQIPFDVPLVKSIKRSKKTPRKRK